VFDFSSNSTEILLIYRYSNGHLDDRKTHIQSNTPAEKSLNGVFNSFDADITHDVICGQAYAAVCAVHTVGIYCRQHDVTHGMLQPLIAGVKASLHV